MSTEPVTRSTVEYKGQFDRFIVNTKNFSQQYNKIYLARLSHMRDALRTVAAKKWPECSILSEIIDIESEHEKVDGENKEFILIGTLYKDMSLRGSVLDEFKEKNGISGAVQSFYQIASKNDSLVLEDESGRVALGGPLLLPHVGELVTGVVMAVKGCVDDLGVLNVQDWTFMHSVSSTDTTSSTSGSGCGTLQEQQYNIPTPTNTSKYILLVSGLQVGNPTTTGPTTVENTVGNVPAAGGSELSAQLLFDFVAGRLTGRTEDIAVASKIARVIIAGDSVAPVEETALVKDKQSSFKAQKLAVSPSKQFDVLLGQLLAVCPVVLLPGETDPSNLTLPQQPLHPCLFPHSSRFNSFHRVTNPYQARMDHIIVLGHSGQAVSDIARQRLDCLPDTTTGTEAMEVEGDELVVPDTTTASTSSRQEPPRCSGNQSVHILRDTLSWGHLCPTSPDTLACYPFETVDPFIVPDTDIPDVLFCGNQNEYGTALVSVHNSDGSSKQVRLVSLPCFSTTGQAVLVDINSTTLTTTVLHFR